MWRYSYTPTSATAGALTYAGSGDGITMAGSGTYTIAGTDPGAHPDAQRNGCVNLGGCRARRLPSR